jgi:hypothetical protein
LNYMHIPDLLGNHEFSHICPRDCVEIKLNVLRYYVLMPTSGANPMRLLYVIGVVSVVTACVSCYGGSLCSKLAAMGGELGGGELGIFAKFFGFISSVVSLVLMLSTSAAVYTAVLLPIQKVPDSLF